MKGLRTCLILAVLSGLTVPICGQKLYQRKTEFLQLIYYDPAHEYLTYHLVRSFENSLGYHRRLFDYTPSEPIVTLFQDFGDYGHGGTSTVPWNYLNIGIEPFDYVYETMPSNERMNWLMHHELVHVVATDKGADRDLVARRFFHGKVAPEKEQPLSIFYSYLTSPRWYAPRWYQEGIAVFLETWMAGGIGRALGGYDEMVFRAMVLEDDYFYDVVGLESEGKTIDFQVGQNSYLYGTRFVSYLADRYGPERLLEWFDRKPGTEPYFSRQFTRVYGTSLDDEWRAWIESEHAWQRDNLALVRQYPVTPERRLTDHALGSVSRSYVDGTNGLLYAAVNYPGKPARIVSIDLRTGEEKTLGKVIGPALYYVTSLAFDQKGRKLFYTTDNGQGWRDLFQIDLQTGRASRLMKDFRAGDLVVNPADRSIWGMQHHNGYSTLVRIAPPYGEWENVLKLEYGRDIYDLDISPDGKTLACSLTEVSGRHRLVSMQLDALLAGDSSFRILHEFVDNSPSNFVFSDDGRYLYGTSYYSGVSNVFRYELETGRMEAMSNTETGYFRPIPLSDRGILVYRYTADGLTPVTIPAKVVEDVNAVHYLGQHAFETHPELDKWKAGTPANIDLDEVTTFEGPYIPFRNVRFASVFLTLEGYKDSAAVGVRFNFADPLGLHSLKITAGYSPDTELESDERVHFDAIYDMPRWTMRLRYNSTDFYDLFGPTKASRKGSSASVSFDDFIIYERPRTLSYKIDAAYWRDLDALPDYQNIGVFVDDYLTAGASMDYSNLRRTIGAVAPERGVQWSLGGRLNYVDAELIPLAWGSFDFGIPLPIEHSTLWIRSAAGRSFRGVPDNAFANFFFGGFGNNWVDHKEVQRYRDFEAFPGLEINEVGGPDFAKVTAEWSLPAVRFRRAGRPGLYSNWARLSLFGSSLVTDLADEIDRRELSSVGAQIDFSVVLFSTLESMFSVGYARAFEHGIESNEVMVSLCLLR